MTINTNFKKKLEFDYLIKNQQSVHHRIYTRIYVYIYIYGNLTFDIKQIYFDMEISFQRKDILEVRCSIIIARHAKIERKKLASISTGFAV